MPVVASSGTRRARRPGRLISTWAGTVSYTHLNECRPLFDAECIPRLRELLPPAAIAKRTLRAAMIPESQADKLLAPIYTAYTDVETTILAHAGDIQLTLLCAKSNAATARQRRCV